MTSVEQARELDRLLNEVRYAAFLQKRKLEEFDRAKTTARGLEKALLEAHRVLSDLSYDNTPCALTVAQRNLADFLIKKTT